MLALVIAPNPMVTTYTMVVEAIPAFQFAITQAVDHIQNLGCEA